MGAAPYWDYDPVMGEWGWAKPAPPSQRTQGSPDPARKARKKVGGVRALLSFGRCALLRLVSNV